MTAATLAARRPRRLHLKFEAEALKKSINKSLQ